ncbi:hypothetical protein Q9Q94_12550 [Uliginosibacterium sp. 31-16]|uniref:hypothetical protein n=1 Tax=Uliginosibacterium sp. 31-16 TaxID=3068315 RepID=UPI00273DE06A|nr:hypothetical protein [Uliginosibacterium sp. 31-16]MDP5240365.1 hypothetical protein [Uliginosibacterium sp. 31-16]
MKNPANPNLRRTLRRLALLASISLLAACGGGGVENILNSLWIYSVDAPSHANNDADVTVTARASSTGNISDDDMDWSWHQNSGKEVSNLSIEKVGNSSVLRFKAPSENTTVSFTVKVEAKGLSDSENLSITVD